MKWSQYTSKVGLITKEISFLQEFYQATAPKVKLVKELMGHLLMILQTLLPPLQPVLNNSELVASIPDTDEALIDVGYQDSNDEAVHGTLIGTGRSVILLPNFGLLIL